MTQALDLTKNDRVLEIGTGSGYQAAVLAEIAYRVYTIERIRPLYVSARRLFDEMRLYNIVTRYGDGSKGWEEEAPSMPSSSPPGPPRSPRAWSRNWRSAAGWWSRSATSTPRS
jgi:protein-L-isoaspartate(D-aspartate) O-methyltransferase